MNPNCIGYNGWNISTTTGVIRLPIFGDQTMRWISFMTVHCLGWQFIMTPANFTTDLGSLEEKHPKKKPYQLHGVFFGFIKIVDGEFLPSILPSFLPSFCSCGFIFFLDACKSFFDPQKLCFWHLSPETPENIQRNPATNTHIQLYIQHHRHVTNEMLRNGI